MSSATTAMAVQYYSGQEVVMQVNEDGSFATMPLSLNSYSVFTKLRCQHNQWNLRKVFVLIEKTQIEIDAIV